MLGVDYYIVKRASDRTEVQASYETYTILILSLSFTHTHYGQASLWYEGRRLVFSSEEFPLSHAHPSRLSSIKTPPKFYLFEDAFVIVQVCTT